MKALRFNEGKPEISRVLAFDQALADLSEVMKYGEEKYGLPHEVWGHQAIEDLVGLCSCGHSSDQQIVTLIEDMRQKVCVSIVTNNHTPKPDVLTAIQTESPTLEDSVDLVTTENCESETQNMPIDKETTQPDGLSQTLTEFVNGKEDTKVSQEENRPLEESSLQALDSMKNTSPNLPKMDAKYAKNHPIGGGLTSTMTMTLEGFVDFSVENAIRGSVFLGMMSPVYGEHLITCKTLLVRIGKKSGELKVNWSCPDNWKLGGKPSQEYMDSGLRHINAFLNGETVDPESGCKHLSHAAWNMLAADYFDS